MCDAWVRTIELPCPYFLYTGSGENVFDTLVVEQRCRCELWEIHVRGILYVRMKTHRERQDI